MRDGYKNFLKIWLFIFFIFKVFDCIEIFDLEFLNTGILNKLFDIGSYPFHISSIILFVYVCNNGEEEVGKFGIFSVILFCVLYILNEFSVFSLSSLSAIGLKDRICSTLYFASSNCINVAEYMALFTLIKGNEIVNVFKSFALLGIIGFTILGLLDNLFVMFSGKLFMNIKSILDSIGYFAKYAAIIFYLTDNDYVSGYFEQSSIEQTKLSSSQVTSTNANPVEQQILVSNNPEIQSPLEEIDTL